MQQAALKNAKADLNLLMVTDPAENFEVADTIIFKEVLNYDELRKKLSVNNTQIELSKYNREIARMNYRLTHAPIYPQLDFFTNYNFNKTNYDYGQTRMNQNYGPTVGLNLSYTLYNGLNRQRTSANAKIQMENSQYQQGETVKALETAIYQLYNEYENNLKLINFERANLKITQTNTSVAYQKYKLGELSDIDLRQIQLNELQAENSLLLAQFQAKQTETELLRLSGQLITN
jgi:outer membrane protein TolC